MNDLPISVYTAIRRTVGHSQDQRRKAEYDAKILFNYYDLPPEKWDRPAFHRMAVEKHWSEATEAHRWSIFQRVLDALQFYGKAGCILMNA